jgi:hypothetical protein
MIWIPDNTVGLASLKIHSQNTGSNYQTLCDLWLKNVKKNCTDVKTGLLCSRIDSKSGLPIEEPRGSMLGWSIFFIYRFDKAYANELYQNYINRFSDNLLLFRLFRERSTNRKTNQGDIDSGPIYLGYSIPANAFAFGDAIAMNDFKNAKRLQRLISIGSKQISNNNEIYCQSRFIDLPINPLADALLLYFETMTEWKK